MDTYRYSIDLANVQPVQIKELVEVGHSVIKIKKAPSQSGSKSKQQEEPVPILHPLEVFLIERAIQNANSKGSKAVLVDIFVRDSDGEIKIDGGKPITHTIVLCRGQSNQFVVIDPNNSEFSQHLEFNSACVFDAGISAIVAPSNLLKIYIVPAKASKGYAADKYRDCIDVAVKLALGFQLMQSAYLDPKDLLRSEVIKMISNNDTIDKYVSTDLPVRIKQSSDVTIVKYFNQLQRIVKLNFDRLSATCDEDKLEKYDDQYKSVLKQQSEPIHLDKLLGFDQELLSALNLEHQDLVTFAGDLVP